MVYDSAWLALQGINFMSHRCADDKHGKGKDMKQNDDCDNSSFPQPYQPTGTTMNDE